MAPCIPAAARVPRAPLRVMLVEIAVSSMNTSRLGSSCADYAASAGAWRPRPGGFAFGRVRGGPPSLSCPPGDLLWIVVLVRLWHLDAGRGREVLDGATMPMRMSHMIQPMASMVLDNGIVGWAPRLNLAPRLEGAGGRCGR